MIKADDLRYMRLYKKPIDTESETGLLMYAHFLQFQNQEGDSPMEALAYLEGFLRALELGRQ